MKSLNLLSFFKRPSVLAFAMLIAGVFAFSSNATADEKKFDVLSGVTAQVLTPPAMDATWPGIYSQVKPAARQWKGRAIGAPHPNVEKIDDLSTSRSGFRETRCRP